MLINHFLKHLLLCPAAEPHLNISESPLFDIWQKSGGMKQQNSAHVAQTWCPALPLVCVSFPRRLWWNAEEFLTRDCISRTRRFASPLRSLPLKGVSWSTSSSPRTLLTFGMSRSGAIHKLWYVICLRSFIVAISKATFDKVVLLEFNSPMLLSGEHISIDTSTQTCPPALLDQIILPKLFVLTSNLQVFLHPHLPISRFNTKAHFPSFATEKKNA